MAHFVRVRSVGGWVGVTAVDPSEFETFDAQVFAAINGDAGGSWNPTLAISIGGQGLNVTGPLVASDCRNHTFASAYKVIFSSGVATAIQLGADRFIDMAAGSAIEMVAGALINNAGTITCTSGGALVCASGSSVAVQSGSTFIAAAGATVAFASDVTITGKVTRTGSGGRTVGRVLAVTDVNTLAGCDYDSIHMTVNGAANIVLTLKIATAPTPVASERIYIRRLGSGAGGLTVKNEGSAANIVDFVGANKGSAIVEFDGSKWRLAADPYNGTAGADAA